MRSNRKRNWIVKRIALGFVAAAFAVPVAQAGVDQGIGVQPSSSANVYKPFDTDFPSYPSQTSDYGEPQAVAAGFDWKDAGIGAGSALALVLLGGGAVLVTRQGRPQTAS